MERASVMSIVWWAKRVRDHLFFACPYSYTIWRELTSSLLHRPSPDRGITITTLLSPRMSNINSCLLQLSFEAVIHSVWREQNSRKHTGAYRTAQQLTRFIDKTIRNRISSLRSKDAEKCSILMIRWMRRNE